jgi:FK506-binding protein 4/5
MKKNEACIVTIPSEYGFEEEDKQCDLALVPANSTLTYEIEMDSFEKAKDPWDMDTAQKLVEAAKKKNEGNSLFKSGKIFHAARKYEKGCRFVDFETVFEDGDEKREARSLKMSLKLNDAACKLKLKDYSEAIHLTTKCLESDPVNVKALYRRAQAYSATMDLELAEEDIKKALEIDPENRDTKLEQKRLNQKIAAHRKKEAKLYGNMFERMRKMEEKESKQSSLGIANLAQAEPVRGNPELSMEANAPQVSVQG